MCSMLRVHVYERFGFGAGKSSSGLSKATQLAPVVTAKQATTTTELALVLGYTFHAHSCAAQIRYTSTGCRPLRQSRKGVDQAR